MSKMMETPRYTLILPLVSLPHGVPCLIFGPEQLLAWTEVGLETVGDCYSENALIPFEDLVENNGLSVGQFIQYETRICTFGMLWGRGREELVTHTPTPTCLAHLRHSWTPSKLFF